MPAPPVQNEQHLPAGGGGASLRPLLARIAGWFGRSAPAPRNHQEELSSLARQAGAAYWEQDQDGRYLRIDGAALPREGLVDALLGRARWEVGSWVASDARAESASPVPAGDGWARHRQAFSSRETFGDLVWAKTVGDATVLLCESGAPRFGADGRFLGYSGLLREAGERIALECVAQALRTALGNSGIPFMQIDACADGAGWRPAWINPAGCALLGRTQLDALSADPFEFLREAPGADGESPAAAIGAAIARGDGLRRPAHVVDSRGAEHAVDLVLDVVAAHGAFQRVATLWLDPTTHEAVAVRERLGELERLLAERAAKVRELASAARELELFSSAVSHDLRSPLRVVDGFATILKEDFAGVLGRFGLDHVDRIISATTRMNQMIDSMLKLARVSSGPIENTPVDLSEMAASIVDELRGHEPQREVIVSVAPAMATLGDRTLLRIVLENLIGNAWKYTGRTAEPRIEIGAHAEGAVQVFCVSDNGAGFDMRFANRLFRVFQRLHGASEFPGTGIGLATVSRIVRRHGGRIWADSAPGQGARFYFTLNEEPASPDDAREHFGAGAAR